MISAGCIHIRNGLLDCKYRFLIFRRHQTDSFCQITSLGVPFIGDEEDDDEFVYYDLPPSVSHLHRLQKIEM